MSQPTNGYISLGEFTTLIKARYPVLLVETFEEGRFLKALKHLSEDQNKEFSYWSIAEGWTAANGDTMSDERDAGTVIQEFLKTTYKRSHILVLFDMHKFWEDPRVTRWLKIAADRLPSKNKTLVLLCPEGAISLSKDLEKSVTIVDFKLPNYEQIQEQIKSLIQPLLTKEQVKENIEKLTQDDINEVARACLGLTKFEIENVISKSIISKLTIDVRTVLDEKKQIVSKNGMIEFYETQEDINNVGGNDNLIKWLTQRKSGFTQEARDYGLPSPRGALILGVQGCGKSLVCKAVANNWNMPLLKVDVGRLFGSFVGQSEANVRSILKLADSIAPCVLWIDEIEKGLSGTGSSGSTDGGTTARVFATILTWMQDKKSPVFVVATANNISALPPELLRKGRFDEIFYVDLPTQGERETIFNIHLNKRNRKPSAFEVKKLARAAKGFSGAEIEEAIVSAMFKSFSDKQRELSDLDIIDAIQDTTPLSVTMKERIEELRAWASNRARKASSQTEYEKIGQEAQRELEI